MELYNGMKVETHIVPLKGYFVENNGFVKFIDAMRTDIFSDGAQYVYGVSIDDDIPDFYTDEYYDWVQERKDSTSGVVTYSDIDRLDWQCMTGCDQRDMDEYGMLYIIVRLFENYGVVVSDDVYEQLAKLKRTWNTPIRCVETDTEYKSVRDCSSATGIPYMTIYNCVKNKNAHKQTGFHFEKVSKRKLK